MKNAVVIGAGFSGLASALLLSQSGLDVTLIERADHAAPLLRNYSSQGFDINNGFHYLGGYYPGGALHQSFDRLGLSASLQPVSIDGAGFDCFRGLGREELLVPVGLDRVQAALDQAFPHNERALADYFKLTKDVFQEFSFFNLEEYFFKIDPALINTSPYEFLIERKADAALIEFFDVYSQMLLGTTVREVPLITHLLGIGAYFCSAHTFKGGGGALAQALEDRVRQSGVRILTGYEVVQVESGSRRHFSGLRLKSCRDGAETSLSADACVCTIHPKRLLGLLPKESAFNLYSNRISAYGDTQAICLLHLAIDREIARDYVRNVHVFRTDGPVTARHRISLLPDLGASLDPSAPEQRATVLLTAWDNIPPKECPQRASAGCSGSPGVPAGQDGSAEPEYFKPLRKRAVARLEENFPELKGRYRIIGAVSPCHLERLNATWNGSIYGLKCTINRIGLTTIGPMKDLFLAGQSVVAPGIFGTLVSAYLASHRIIRRNN